jgi:hypothetical protein
MKGMIICTDIRLKFYEAKSSLKFCSKILMSRQFEFMPIIYHGRTAPGGPGPPHYGGFTITFSHTTLDMTPPDR